MHIIFTFTQRGTLVTFSSKEEKMRHETDKGTKEKAGLLSTWWRSVAILTALV